MTCTIEDCSGRVHYTGLCARHYSLHREAARIEESIRLGRMCACGEPVRNVKRGLCKVCESSDHYRRTDSVPRIRTNETYRNLLGHHTVTEAVHFNITQAVVRASTVEDWNHAAKLAAAAARAIEAQERRS